MYYVMSKHPSFKSENTEVLSAEKVPVTRMEHYIKDALCSFGDADFNQKRNIFIFMPKQTK